jgi:hypothetical protein
VTRIARFALSDGRSRLRTGHTKTNHEHQKDYQHSTDDADDSISLIVVGPSIEMTVAEGRASRLPDSIPERSMDHLFDLAIRKAIVRQLGSTPLDQNTPVGDRHSVESFAFRRSRSVIGTFPVHSANLR